jgi:selenium metabolism protein YedF
MSEITTVDARGLSCPQPVLETKKALENGDTGNILVLVDNPTSKENVSRFARNQGCDVSVREKGEKEFEISLKRTATSVAPQQQEELLACAVTEPSTQQKHVVYIGNAYMGSGDDALGEKLIRGFLQTLIDCNPLPWRMIFINSGVKLTTIDDAAVEAVSMLEQKGVEVLSCGTCLQHFGLEEQLKVGKATNMFEVIESLNSATKVISPD